MDDFLKFLEMEQEARQHAAEAMNLVFVDNQGAKHYLSAAMVKKQKVSSEQIEQLKQLHIQLNDTLKEATNPNVNLSEIQQRVQEIEFKMQDAWNYERDANFHTHWKRIPGCVCPKMDNDDPAYFGRGKIIIGNCPIHGNKK